MAGVLIPRKQRWFNKKQKWLVLFQEYFYCSEMTRDQAKVCLASNHRRQLSKIILTAGEVGDTKITQYCMKWEKNIRTKQHCITNLAVFNYPFKFIHNTFMYKSLSNKKVYMHCNYNSGIYTSLKCVIILL